MRSQSGGPISVLSLVLSAVALLCLIGAPDVAASKKCEAALAAFQSGQYVNAVPMLRTAMDKGECPSYFRLYVGIAQARIGNSEAAIATLQQFLEDYPTAANGWHELGLVHFARAELAEAEAALRKSVTQGPNPEVWKDLGRVLVALNKDSEAQEALSAAAELDPHDFECRYLLARMYQEKGRTQEAVALFQAAIRLNPDHARSHAHLGTAYGDLAEDERAVDSFEKAISLSSSRQSIRRGSLRRPEDPVPHYEFGVYLADRGRLDEARSRLDSAVRLAPGQTEPRYQLSRVLLLSGNLPLARIALLEAIALDEKDARVHNLLSQVCYKQGDQECGDAHAARSEQLRKIREN